MPVCKDNVVCLPAKLAQSLGGMGRVAVVHKVNGLVHLIDPNTAQCKYCGTGELGPGNLFANTVQGIRPQNSRCNYSLSSQLPR